MFSSLVVDDEIVSRLKMERYLSHLGPCQAVSSGLEALEAFKEAWANWTPIELMTLDVSMPEMDGAQTLIEIRNLEKEKGVSPKNRVKVLMVTGFSDRDTIMACVQAGCDSYISKPFGSIGLEKKLREFGLISQAGPPHIDDSVCSPPKL